MSFPNLYTIKYIKGDNYERAFDLSEGRVLNLCGDTWTVSDEGEGAKLHFITEDNTSSDSRVIKPGQTFVAPRYEAIVVAVRPEGSEDACTSTPKFDNTYKSSDNRFNMTIDPHDTSAPKSYRMSGRRQITFGDVSILTDNLGVKATAHEELGGGRKLKTHYTIMPGETKEILGKKYTVTTEDRNLSWVVSERKRSGPAATILEVTVDDPDFDSRMKIPLKMPWYMNVGDSEKHENAIFTAKEGHLEVLYTRETQGILRPATTRIYPSETWSNSSYTVSVKEIDESEVAQKRARGDDEDRPGEESECSEA
ncbi:uncharacterized protein L199_001119 [Kwoniella botswanensis]|uniref:uncharacterized protein n=1 Tax=Kwoniella botswanensis TaxID=1268659 RepID=UPI00315CAA2D